MGGLKNIEWKSGADLGEARWPFCGYAPGAYMGKCRRCGGHYVEMDKRAWHCLSCAISVATEKLESFQNSARELKEENDTLKRAIGIVEQCGSTNETCQST